MKMMRSWLKVVRTEGVSLRKGLRMLWAFRMGVVGARKRRERLLVCAGCPLFNPVLEQCRPFPGHRLGCGCWVPALVWCRRPYAEGCWGRTYVPGKRLGWE